MYDTTNGSSINTHLIPIHTLVEDGTCILQQAESGIARAFNMVADGTLNEDMFTKEANIERDQASCSDGINRLSGCP